MNSQNTIDFYFDGRPMRARSGQTIAEALLANGVMTFRHTRQHQPRGAYCGMGVCNECRAVVDGRPNIRTCMTEVRPGCRVDTQLDDNMEGCL